MAVCLDVSGSIIDEEGTFRQMIAFVTDFYDYFNFRENQQNFIPFSAATFSNSAMFLPGFGNLNDTSRNKSHILESFFEITVDDLSNYCMLNFTIK